VYTGGVCSRGIWSQVWLSVYLVDCVVAEYVVEFAAVECG
jgi:hypothetical protein